MGSSDLSLTSREAYLAMFEFLDRHYQRGPTDEIGGLLGGLSLLNDGGTADPSAWLDWQEAVEAILSARSSGGYTAANLRLN